MAGYSTSLSTILEGNITTSYELNATAWPLFHLSVSFAWVVFYAIVYFAIFLGTLIGNQLVIWSYILEPKLRRPTNVFIVSLSVADFVTGLIAVPLVVLSRLFQSPFICLAATRPYLHLTSFMMCTTSMVHLIFITLDRYIAVTRPLKYPTVVTRRRCKIIVLLVWIIGCFLGSIPVMFPVPTPDRWVCGITSYEGTNVSIHRLGTVAIIPFILSILCVCYLRMFAIASRHIRAKSDRLKAQVSAESIATSDRKAMYRTTVTTSIVLGAFAVCWLPTTAKFLIEIYVPATDEQLFIIQTTSEVLGFANSMVNPIIYAYRNALFRSTYKAILRSLYRRCCNKSTDLEKVEDTRTISTVSSSVV